MPNLANVPAKLCQILINLANGWLHLANIGQTPAKFNQCWPTLANRLPNSASSVKTWTCVVPAAKVRSITLDEVVRGRIVVLSLRGAAGAPPLDVANVHLVSDGRTTSTMALQLLRGALRERREASTVLLGDFNFLSPAEGRYEVRTGRTRYATSVEATMFADLFGDFTEAIADGFSRQQFRDGEVDLLSRLDHAYINGDAEELIGGRCQARYTEPMGSVRAASDHSPLEVRFLPPRQWRRVIPPWVARHPAFSEAVTEAVAFALAHSAADPYAGIAHLTRVMHEAARAITP